MTGDLDATDELRARLRRVEDLLEINQLFIDYGRHLDTGDFAAYGALFARDGEVLLGPLGRAKGPAAIEELMTRLLERDVGKTFHVISSPVVDLDGDNATAQVMWTAIARTDDDQPRISMIGRHVDRLVREDGRWRFKRREGEIDIPSRYGTKMAGDE